MTCGHPATPLLRAQESSFTSARNSQASHSGHRSGKWNDAPLARDVSLQSRACLNCHKIIDLQLCWSRNILFRASATAGFGLNQAAEWWDKPHPGMCCKRQGTRPTQRFAAVSEVCHLFVIECRQVGREVILQLAAARGFFAEHWSRVF